MVNDTETVAICEGRSEGHAVNQFLGAVVRDVDRLTHVSTALKWLARLPLECARVFVDVNCRGKLSIYPGVEERLVANSSNQFGRICHIKIVILRNSNTIGCRKHVKHIVDRDFWFQYKVVVCRHVKIKVGFWSSDLSEDGLRKCNWAAVIIGFCYEIVLWHFVDNFVAE